MRSTSRLMASAVGRRSGASVSPVGRRARRRARSCSRSTHVASLAPGSIQGIVQDERGAPVAGAMVSALGATTAFAVTDRSRPLRAADAVARARTSCARTSSGFVALARPDRRGPSERARLVVDRAAARGRRRAAARRCRCWPPASAAAVDPAPAPPRRCRRRPARRRQPADDDHGEMAWRLRHARRGILKDADRARRDPRRRRPPPARTCSAADVFGRAADRRRALATNFFADTPFSGQVNLLTTGSFDTPQQLFSADNFARSIAYLSLGAPVGEHADWTVRGALTQGDIVVVDRRRRVHDARAGAPSLRRRAVVQHAALRRRQPRRAARRHRRQPQRRRGVRRSTRSRSRRRSTLTYGARYARYDYLDERSLLSPRVALTVDAGRALPHQRAARRSRAVAPGAEEFLPPSDSGIWLPPQRTFSSLEPGAPLRGRAHRPRRGRGRARPRRRVDRVAARVPSARRRSARHDVRRRRAGRAGAQLGHYFVGNAGDVDATGCERRLPRGDRRPRPRLGRVHD